MVAKGQNPKIISPWDTYNRQLVSHVHPADWQNPTPAGRYNLVVIGAGTAGLVCAAGAAGLGAKVALIERHLMGGDCLNVGCVPSKAMIRAARAAADVRDAGDFGVQVPVAPTIDFGQAMERMRRLRASIAPHDSAQRFSDLGIDVFIGEGRFLDPHRVEVAGQPLAFKKAVIATGARAAAPPVEGLQEISYLTNETVFSLTDRPKRLGVIGAGPIDRHPQRTVFRPRQGQRADHPLVHLHAAGNRPCRALREAGPGAGDRSRHLHAGAERSRSRDSRKPHQWVGAGACAQGHR